jgi:hypothetical protein
MPRICALRGLWRACLRSGVCVPIPFSNQFWSNKNLIYPNKCKVGTGRARNVRFACLLVCLSAACGALPPAAGLRVCGSMRTKAGRILRQAGGAREGAKARRRGGAEAGRKNVARSLRSLVVSLALLASCFDLLASLAVASLTAFGCCSGFTHFVRLVRFAH